jgi:dTDP-4-dehydrorhamnose reductase
MRLLVIGQDSAIGAAITDAARARGDEVTTTALLGPADIRLDLAADTIPDLPDSDAIVFVAAMSRFADCRAQPILARKINVTAMTAIAAAMRARSAKPVLLSTAAVFDGSRPAPDEHEPPSPASDYGMLKAEAERNILDLGGAVLRMTKVLSPATPLFQTWFSSLRRNAPVEAFSDLLMAPVGLQDAVQAVLALTAPPAQGIYHLSSNGQISYAQAARHIAGRLGVSPGLVAEKLGANSGLPASQIVRFADLGGERLTQLTKQSKPEPMAVLDRVFWGDPRERI